MATHETHSAQVSQPSFFADGHPVPDLLTEEDLIRFLRIREVSTSKDYSNVVDNLIKIRDLPRMHIGNRRLYPRHAILEWMQKQIIK